MKMDVLAGVVSEDRAENGAWLHLLTPDGDPIYKDPGAKTLPVRAKVRATSSKAFRELSERLQNRVISKTSRLNRRDREKMLEEESRLERPRKFACLFLGLENAEKDKNGFVACASEDEAMEICNRADLQWMVNQIFDFAQNDANFGIKEGNADAPPPPVPSSELENV